MNKVGNLIVAGLSLSAAFGVAVVSAFHWGKDVSYDEGYEQGKSDMREMFYQQRVDCQEAREVSGILLGQYILGENGVTSHDVDTAEQAEVEACRSFEF